MYEIIDKNLMIEACNIGDLTLDQVERFLRLWGDGSEIKSLTLFLKNDGTIVLNRDNPNYEHYKELVYICLKGDKETREELLSIMFKYRPPGEGVGALGPGGGRIINNLIGAPVCYQYYRSK